MHEAQMIDSRMNLNTLFTSSIESFIPGMKGSNLANYTEVIGFKKDEQGKIVGANLKDRDTLRARAASLRRPTIPTGRPRRRRSRTSG